MRGRVAAAAAPHRPAKTEKSRHFFERKSALFLLRTLPALGVRTSTGGGGGIPYTLSPGLKSSASHTQYRQPPDTRKIFPTQELHGGSTETGSRAVREVRSAPACLDCMAQLSSRQRGSRAWVEKLRLSVGGTETGSRAVREVRSAPACLDCMAQLSSRQRGSRAWVEKLRLSGGGSCPGEWTENPDLVIPGPGFLHVKRCS